MVLLSNAIKGTCCNIFQKQPTDHLILILDGQNTHCPWPYQEDSVLLFFGNKTKTKSERREEAGAKDWLLVVHKSWRENEKTDCILGDNGGENKEKKKN